MKQASATSIRDEIGKEGLLNLYREMLLIRRFEERAVTAYQQAKIAGFLHPYIGTEAVATSVFAHLQPQDYNVTSYRCHAQALLSGLNPDELMAELFGKITGNVRGKGGSMHFFSKEKNMLGGHGIVGGQVPVGTGGAFACKYTKNNGVSVAFMGDGATAQGSVHESMNIASLWDLPAVYIVENNQFGMGTACSRAVSVERIAESRAPAYNMTAYTIEDGTDLIECWSVMKQAVHEARSKSRPVFIEAKTVRFMGHSVTDAQTYRTKADIAELRESRDCLDKTAGLLIDAGWATTASLEEIDDSIIERVLESVKYAESSDIPPMSELLTNVLAD